MKLETIISLILYILAIILIFNAVLVAIVAPRMIAGDGKTYYEDVNVKI